LDLEAFQSRYCKMNPKRKMQDIRGKDETPNFESRALSLRSSPGLSLIAVMWIVTILTVLASEFIYSMRLEARIAKNWRDQVSAFYAAKGGTENAIALLKSDETEYDSLDEEWAQELTGELNESTYITMITDESARINVNTADEETLTRAIVYCMGSVNEEMSEEMINAEAQTLAAAIIEARPYRTVAEMAKATSMTPEILYGKSVTAVDGEERATVEEIEEDENEEVQSSILVDITTIHSVDKNVDSDGTKRVNMNSADASQIQQGINPEGNEVITQQEAQAIVDYRSELGGGQSGQSGGSNQGGPPNQSGGADQGGGTGEGDQGEGYDNIGQLLDVPAISQQTLDSIRDRITVEDEEGEGDDRGETRVNINTANANELQNLSDRIDSGIADSIVRYREQNQFDNVDEIREVKLISLDDMKAIVDKVTISDDEVLQGKVNINTAPLEILKMLPGLDEEKAQAIIDRRTLAEGLTSTAMTSQEGGQETGPFTSIGQLLDVQGIDENTFKSLVGNVACRSQAFRIQSEGRSSDRKIIQDCIAVVDRSGNRVKIRYWKQG
jgi:competence ComEA-like helix-hairpin-helix protein